MTRAARQLHTLIEGLLEYTRVESGRIVSRSEPVDLGRLVRETVDEYRLYAPDENVEMRWEAPDSPAPPVVQSDQRLLKVVLGNLVGNAVKFTKEGTITVRAERRERACVMEVHDTGIGIPPDALDRIFQPFEQLEPLQRKSIPGVGLGLTLVRQIVQALGGAIQVNSQVGMGATFRISLPLQRSDDSNLSDGDLGSDHNDDLSRKGP